MAASSATTQARVVSNSIPLQDDVRDSVEHEIIVLANRGFAEFRFTAAFLKSRGLSLGTNHIELRGSVEDVRAALDFPLESAVDRMDLVQIVSVPPHHVWWYDEYDGVQTVRSTLDTGKLLMHVLERQTDPDFSSEILKAFDSGAFAKELSDIVW
jgi:hypothetical protein